MNRKLNSFILFFLVTFSIAQIDVKFIKHLSNNNLANEHNTYLNSLTPNLDSTYYFKAKFHLKYPNDSLFMSNYIKSKPLCDTDTLMLKEATIYFLNSSNTNTRRWLTLINEKENNSCSNLIKIYNGSVNPNLYSKNAFPSESQNLYLKYKKVYRKKPMLAAIFSSLLPGSGKLYAGKTKTFLLTFILNAAYAAQTIESSQKLGIKHPLSIINASAFSVFYLSNIYGSFKAVIDLRKERKKQFIINATKFYN